jgi:hypothetical protein
VNADEPPGAQRFSVAHELGHHFLGSEHGDGEIAEREVVADDKEMTSTSVLRYDAALPNAARSSCHVQAVRAVSWGCPRASARASRPGARQGDARAQPASAVLALS